MDVNIQLLATNSRMPTRATDGSGAFDLYVSSLTSVSGYVEYDTGVAVEIPPGHVGLIFPRSSIRATNQSFCNAVGLVDSDYRGPVKVSVYRMAATGKVDFYSAGDRCGQLLIIPYPEVSLVQVSRLSETKRGSGAHGSTGR